MRLNPGQEIGEEIHSNTEQTFVFVSGTGRGVLRGRNYPITPGVALVVPAGMSHNVISTGREALKFFTIYAPPNHPPYRVDRTKPSGSYENPSEEDKRTMWALAGVGITAALLTALLVSVKKAGETPPPQLPSR